ncbi:MAG: hypothetical protein M9928_18855 [Anaerolineae bacterium]|nr:hypothetical protein [Anaerolineae bacterium]MCO5199492.1 hypothetical protein [Anaerolineae bacterium]MCO5207074.1 hypothetical protein [Anaerolineae bacterium]
MFTYKDVYVKQEYHNENLRAVEHRRLIREVTSAEKTILHYLYLNATNSLKRVFAGIRSRPVVEEQMAGTAPITPVHRQR